MSVPKFLFKGKPFDPPELYKWVNNSAQHDSQLTPYGIDASQMQLLVLHVYWRQSTRFSSGAVYAFGSNIESVDGPAIAPVSVAGNGSLSGSQVTLANQNDGDVLITYQDMPRWVKPYAGLSGVASMVGDFRVAAFGWL